MVREKFKQILPGECCISSITLAELRYWVANNKHHHEKSQNSGIPKINEKAINDFIAHLLVVDFDSAAADIYGDVRSLFKSKGIVVSSLDLLIGSHAMSLNLTLITNNEKDFNSFPNLKIENWVLN